MYAPQLLLLKLAGSGTAGRSVDGGVPMRDGNKGQPHRALRAKGCGPFARKGCKHRFAAARRDGWRAIGTLFDFGAHDRHSAGLNGSPGRAQDLRAHYAFR